MERLSKDALLGASDLVEKEVELPAIGGSVKVRALAAAYSNDAAVKAFKLVTNPAGEQMTTIDINILEQLQVLHGLIDPQLNSLEEAEKFAQQCGPSFKKLVGVIDEISGVDKEAIEKATATFPVEQRREVGAAQTEPAPVAVGGS